MGPVTPCCNFRNISLEGLSRSFVSSLLSFIAVETMSMHLSEKTKATVNIDKTNESVPWLYNCLILTTYFNNTFPVLFADNRHENYHAT